MERHETGKDKSKKAVKVGKKKMRKLKGGFTTSLYSYSRLYSPTYQKQFYVV